MDEWVWSNGGMIMIRKDRHSWSETGPSNTFSPHTHNVWSGNEPEPERWKASDLPTEPHYGQLLISTTEIHTKIAAYLTENTHFLHYTYQHFKSSYHNRMWEKWWNAGILLTF